MKRREFITLLGGAAVLPLGRAAQERRPIMWRKTVWLIATLTLSIFVAPVAWAQKT